MGRRRNQLPDADRCARLCRELLWLRGKPGLASWAANMAESDGLLAAARDAPMLRVLLQVGAMLGADALLPRLREIYAGQPTADWLGQEDRQAAEHSLSELLTSARDWLGFAKRRQRRRPFRIAGRSPKANASKAPITVLDITDDLARSDRESLRSIESQTLAPTRVLPLAGEGAFHDRLGPAIKDLQTPYVALLTDAASYHPLRLECCLSALQQASQPAVVCTGLFHVDDRGRQVSAAASNRLELGSRLHAWIQDYERLRIFAKQPDKLVAALLAGDFVISLSNLVCHRDLLRSVPSMADDHDLPLAWQIALHAALDGNLIFLPRKLLALSLPSPEDLASSERNADSQATLAALEHSLGSALAAKDRMARELDMLTTNRDRLEEALAVALGAAETVSPETVSPEIVSAKIVPTETGSRRSSFAGSQTLPMAHLRALPIAPRRRSKAGQALRIAAPIPPDRAAWQTFRRFCRRINSRPHILHWQGETAGLYQGSLLRTDVAAQSDDLAYLRRNHGERFALALSLLGEALGLSPVDLENLHELRLAAVFARKIAVLSPDYLQSWDLNQGSTAAMLAQLLFGIRRGLVLSSLDKGQGIGRKLLPLQLASADLLIVSEPQLARELIERGVESERILCGSDASSLLIAALQDLRSDAHRYQGSRG